MSLIDIQLNIKFSFMIKQKVFPNKIHSPHPLISKFRSKTSQSPSNQLSKERIRKNIKKIVENHSHPIDYPNQTNIQHPSRKEKRVKSNLSIQLPSGGHSVTPKHFRYTSMKSNQRQVQSTKAAGNEAFQSSLKYDLKKQLNITNKKVERQNSLVSKKSGKRQQETLKSPSSRPKRSKIQEDKKLTEKDFQQQCDPRKVLKSSEIEKFGCRFPEKFKRLGLLGKGGFSLVWLASHRSTKRKFAIKQIITKNPHDTHLKEIWFCSYFFQKGGYPRQEFQDHMGINNICKLYFYQINSQDSWLYYQVCGQSLGSSMFQIQNNVVNGEKIYQIEFKETIKRIRSDINELKYLIIEIAKALHLINSHNIVHSDLKTQNIMLKLHKSNSFGNQSYIKEVKIIDFGSSFLFTNLKQFSMATPEYMPPQILNYILFQNKLDYDEEMLKKMDKYKNPWVIDIWSLGCIILQIITGIPLWMSAPTIVKGTQKTVFGLFGVKGRLFNKIISKQIEVIKKLDQYLIKQNHSKIVIDTDISIVLSKMLSLNPEERISPLQILSYFGVACQPQRIPSY